VDLVGHGLDQSTEEVRGRVDVGLLLQLGEGELGGSVDRDEEVKLALLRPDLGDVDVEVADGVGREALLLGLVVPSSSGSRLMPCRSRQRCRLERVRCGIVGWSP
jgi:hypothetical protein